MTMEQLLYTIFGNLRDYESLSPDLLPLMIMFSVAGGVILSKFTGSIGNLTMPINCSALFIGAMTSNWLMQNVKLPIESTVEAPLVFSMIGMTLASFCMMWWLQRDGLHH
jgi:uncharacterized membrane protein YhhN